MKKRIFALLLAVMLVVLAVPTLALSTGAATADILTETWDGGATVTISENARNDTHSVLTFYVWIDGETGRTLVDTVNWGDELLTDDDYAIVNPELIARGIVNADDTYEEQLADYRDYLKDAATITYAGGWSIGTFYNTQYEKVDRRLLLVQNQSILNVRTRKNGDYVIYNKPMEANYATSSSIALANIESYIAMAMDPTYLRPNEEGKIYFVQAKELIPEGASQWGQPCLPLWDWEKGAVVTFDSAMLPSGDVGFTVYPGSTTRAINAMAYGYTVPQDVYGTAKISLNNIFSYGSNTSTPAAFAITLNNEIVWPKNADLADITTFETLGSSDKTRLNKALADLEIEVRDGDVVALLLARSDAKSLTLDVRPTITIEKDCVVIFEDKDGNRMGTPFVAEPGDPMPGLPYACEAGFYINGDTTAVTTLPETVEGDMVIRYADDFTVADITLPKTEVSYKNGRVSLDVYMQVDPYAVNAGMTIGDADVNGELQEDGTYKVTVGNITAKAIKTGVVVYPYQDFVDGGSYAAETDVVLDVYAAITAAKDAATEEEAPLWAALLDYADAADAYFNGTELDEATAARLAEQDAAIEALSKELIVSGLDDFAYRISGATLVLGEQVAIKVKIASAYGAFMTEDALACQVLVEDENGNESYVSGFTYTVGDTLVGEPMSAVVTLNGIEAKDFDEMYEMTILDEYSDTASNTLTYSVNTYIARTFEGGAGEADNLLRALYALGIAA